MEFLIKHPTIVNADKTFKNDILIIDNKIDAVKRIIEPPNNNCKIINANGLYAIPGAIDPHVHMELPTPAGNSSDDFYTGSIAAIYGGTTSIIDFVTPRRGENFIAATQDRKKCASKSLIDYGLHFGVTWWDENSAQQLEYLKKSEGINSFKAYLAYKNSIGIDDSALIKLMKQVSKQNGMLAVHCENGDLIETLQNEMMADNHFQPAYHYYSRPAEAEAEAISRVIWLSKFYNCPVYIVHVSTKEGVELIKQAQDKCLPVFAETCPHYLLLDHSVYNSLDNFDTAKYVISPPLRGKKDNEALWNAIGNGVVQTVATDHCPFNLHGQKDLGLTDFRKIPNGAGSIEHRLSLLFTFGVLQKRISFNQMVDLISHQPAKIFGLDNRKGDIRAGLDADIVLWDAQKETTVSAQTHKMRCDTNIYEGFKLKGAAQYVFVGGKLVLENENLNTSGLSGQFMPCNI